MIRDLDHHAEAVAALKKAVAAPSPAERLKWLQAATAWVTLARLVEERSAA